LFAQTQPALAPQRALQFKLNIAAGLQQHRAGDVGISVMEIA